MTDTPAPRFDPSTIRWVMEPRHIDMLCEDLVAAPEITFDLETTGLDEHVSSNGYPPRIAMASFTLPDGLTRVLPLSHPESPHRGRWRTVMARTAESMAYLPKRVIGHNIKFDMRWTHAHTGVDMAAATWIDTYVLSRLIDENRPGKLKALCSQLYNIPEWSEDLPVPLTTPGAAEKNPMVDLGVYAAQDTFWTWHLSRRLRDILWWDADEGDMPMSPEEWQDERVGRLATKVSTPTLQTLTAIEQRGIRLDTRWCLEELDKAEGTAVRLQEKLTRPVEGLIDGEPSFAPTSKWWLQWTEHQVEQGQLRVISRTRTGTPQWNKATLKRLAKQGFSVAEDVLQMRDAMKRAEFLRAWQALESEGRLHPNFNLGRVVTGRLSSSNPNLQQVTKTLKPAFIPTPKHAIIEADLSQIELRLAAHVSGCERMITAYRAGRDLHIQTASTVVGRNHDLVQQAHMLLMWLGLPANRTGAEALPTLRQGGSAKAVPRAVLSLCGQVGPDQVPGGWERWGADRGVEPNVGGGNLPSSVPPAQEGVLRELRGYYERWGWPWEWETDHAGCPSPQPRPDGQPALEPDDAVQILSQASASELSSATGLPWGDFRQSGKALGFGFLYGMQATKFRTYADDTYGVVMTQDEAEAAHTDFFNLYPELRQWHQRTISQVYRDGFVTSPIGRVRRFDFVDDEAARQAINSPIQGMGSDIMMIGCSLIEGFLPGWPDAPKLDGVRLVGTVHDSLVAEVPMARAHEAAESILWMMTTGADRVLKSLGCDLAVPLEAEATIGTRWGLGDLGEVVGGNR